ncbi:MAG: hypothetical protein LBQ60_11940, partial [Bacteroidales bacterium]|nr:hypothetical protein [Bacteroidales bacterium]
PQGKSDVVEATIEINNGDIDPEKVIFKTPGGTEFKSEYQNGVYTINLIGGEAGDGQEIYAVYPSPQGGAGGGFLNFGKLSVVSYREQTYKVTIVPVNETDVDISAIRQTLKDIYGPVGIAWEVSEEKGYSYFGENKFFEKNSGLLSSYTEEMRKMNADFADNYKNGQIDATANYVFVLKYSGSTMERDAAGFMPRGGQFGYIFTKDFQSDKEILNTIAHELGHGRLLLKHTFDKDYGITRGVTDNLMDYSGKTHLAKWQWDLLSDPGIAQGVFDRDQDGMKAANKEEFDYAKLLAMMRSTGTQSFAFLVNCEIIVEGYKFGNYNVIIGSIDHQTGGINIISKTSENNPIINEIYSGQDPTLISDIQEKDLINIRNSLGSKKQLLLIQNNNNISSCDLTQDYTAYCSEEDLFNSSELLAKLSNDISNCITDRYYETKILVDNIGISIDEVVSAISENLNIPYFSDIKIQVNISNSLGQEATVSTPGLSGADLADINLSYHIDHANKEVHISEIISDRFFQGSKLAPALHQKAGELDIDLELLRTSSLAAMNELKGEKVDFAKRLKALASTLIGTHVSTVQIAGKIGKNIWEESVIPQGMWYSRAEGRAHYENKFDIPSIPAGVTDGLIGEILAVPILIKTTGEIAFNEEKRQAFTQIFTANGFQQLITGIKDDFVASMNDEEKRPYTISKGTVEIASIFIGTGWAKSAGKVGNDLANEMVDILKRIPGGEKVAEAIPTSKLKEFAEKLQKLSEKQDFKKIADQLAEFTPTTRMRFVDDLLADADFYKLILDKPDVMQLFQFHKVANTLSLDEFNDLRAIYLKYLDDPKMIEKWSNYSQETRNLLDRFNTALRWEADYLQTLTSKYEAFASQVSVTVRFKPSADEIARLENLVPSLKRVDGMDGWYQLESVADGFGRKDGIYTFIEVKATGNASNKIESMLSEQQKMLKEILEGREGQLIPHGSKANFVLDSEDIGTNIIEKSGKILNMHKLSMTDGSLIP